MKMERTLGSYIKEKRNEKKLSLRALGELVGISASYISRLEDDMFHPSAEVITRLAENLDIDVKELLRLEGYHAESIGIELEKFNYEGAELLFKLTTLLHDDGVDALNAYFKRLIKALSEGRIDKEDVYMELIENTNVLTTLTDIIKLADGEVK
jgi:transcriptional regulator with XRE-family HTH domain